MSMILRRRGLAVALLLGLLGYVLILLPLPTTLSGLGAWLVLGLPGVLLALLLFDDESDPLLTAFFALCCGLALPSLLLMALHALPGPLPWWLLLLSSAGLSVWLAWLAVRQMLVARGQHSPVVLRYEDTQVRVVRPSGGWLAMLLLGLALLLAAGLRLPNLNSSELQGDEARALLMAVGVRYGQPDVLLVHKKGPVEVLLPAGPLLLLGRVNEGAARLPFALAGVGVVLGTYLVARRLFADEGEPVSLAAASVAAFIVALDGFLIAFSRIVQYQSVLVLMSLGAFWCCWRFYEGGSRPRRDLCLAAALAAVGLLAHYDGIYVVPALAFLVLAGAWRRRWTPQQWLAGLGLPLLLGALLLASFYLPFVTHERFARTAEYLTERTGQQRLGVFSYFYNNLPRYNNLATFYNTTFQMRWLATALLAGGLCWLILYVRPRVLGWAAATLLLAGAGIMYVEPAWFKLAGDGAGNWAIVPFALPLAALIVAPATPAALRALLLWFGGAFIAHAFLLGKPQTHFYTMDTPAALLIGLACARLADWLRSRRLGLLRLPLAAAGAALALLATPYMYIVYVRQNPPYQLVFPKARPELYRAAYDDRLPQQGGYFGFPHNNAWKVVGDLYDRGVLHGDYFSNEEELVTGWYTRGAFRCAVDPVYYIVVARPRDPQEISWEVIRSQYKLFAYVLNGTDLIMTVYSRLYDGEPQLYQLDPSVAAFDGRQVPNFPTQRSLIEILPQHRLDADWSQGLVLRGYDLDYDELEPGRQAIMSLYWQAAQPIDPGYELVVDVLDSEGQVVASADNHCGVHPPARWHSHRVNNTAFRFSPDSTLAPGTYTLRAELRNPQTGARLPLANGASGLDFAQVTVVPSAAHSQ